MKPFLMSLCLILSLTACGAANAPAAADTKTDAANLNKLDQRSQQLLNSGNDFAGRAKALGFICSEQGVLFDLILEQGSYKEELEQALNEIGSLRFLDIHLRRASLFLQSREQLSAVSRSPYVQFVNGTHAPVMR